MKGQDLHFRKKMTQKRKGSGAAGLFILKVTTIVQVKTAVNLNQGTTRGNMTKWRL